VTRVIDMVRRPAISLIALALPLALALFVVRSPTWFPTGDFAQAELHARAVPLHQPLLGAAARVGTIFEQGSHPGPAGAMTLALPYRVLGSSGWSVMAATVVIHLLAMFGALVVARRVGGAGLMVIFAALLAVVVRSFGTQWFLEPWNPWFGVFVLLATVLCAWGVATGHGALLPWFVLAASFCAQVHLAYVPVVVGLGIGLVVALIARRRESHAPSRRMTATALGLGALLWFPPVIDEVTREPGNFTLLWRHFTNPPLELAGWRATLSTFVNEVNLFGSWSTGADPDPSTSPDLVSWLGFLGLLVIVIVAVASTWRRHNMVVRRLWQIVGLTTVLSLVTVTRILGPVNDYLVRWLSMIAVVLLATSIWSLTQQMSTRRTSTYGILGVVAGGALILASVQTVEAPWSRDSKTVSDLAAPLIESTSSDQMHLLRFHDPVALGGPGIGVLLEMERQSRPVGADAWLRANVLPHRIIDEEDADVLVWVVSGDLAIERTRALPGAAMIATTDPRSADEVERSDELRRSIEQDLASEGRYDLVARLDEQYGVSQVEAEPGLSEKLRAALAEYRELRLPTAVITVPVEEQT
jgi:hypothetical protein